jgi:hypothetical protein
VELATAFKIQFVDVIVESTVDHVIDTVSTNASSQERLPPSRKGSRETSYYRAVSHEKDAEIVAVDEALSDLDAVPIQKS